MSEGKLLVAPSIHEPLPSASPTHSRPSVLRVGRRTSLVLHPGDCTKATEVQTEGVSAEPPMSLSSTSNGTSGSMQKPKNLDSRHGAVDATSCDGSNWYSVYSLATFRKTSIQLLASRKVISPTKCNRTASARPSEAPKAQKRSLGNGRCQRLLATAASSMQSN